MSKAKLILNLARSKSYVVLTEKQSVINIPMLNPKNIKDYVLLASQTASLDAFYTRLGELVKDHKTRLKIMESRQGSKLYSKGKVATGTRKK